MDCMIVSYKCTAHLVLETVTHDEDGVANVRVVEDVGDPLEDLPGCLLGEEVFPRHSHGWSRSRSRSSQEISVRFGKMEASGPVTG